MCGDTPALGDNNQFIPLSLTRIGARFHPSANKFVLGSTSMAGDADG